MPHDPDQLQPRHAEPGRIAEGDLDEAARWSQMSRLGLSARPVADTTRECGWCNEQVRVRKDDRLAVHKWQVGWDRERDKPIMGRCVGSGTTEADLERAKS